MRCVKCDKCEESFSMNSNKINFFDYNIGGFKDKFELCDKCTDKLWEWMEK